MEVFFIRHDAYRGPLTTARYGPPPTPSGDALALFRALTLSCGPLPTARSMPRSMPRPPPAAPPSSAPVVLPPGREDCAMFEFWGGLCSDH